jgi:hypothetical protein
MRSCRCVVNTILIWVPVVKSTGNQDMRCSIVGSFALVVLALQSIVSLAQSPQVVTEKPIIVSLDKPTFSLSEARTSDTKKYVSLAVDTVDGCSFSVTAVAGKSFSLQQAGGPTANFVASVNEAGETFLEHLATQVLPDGRVNVSMANLSPSQGELLGFKIARISAKLSHTVPPSGDKQKIDYDQQNCGCCAVSCVRSDGKPFVWTFCGCGCVDCSANGGGSCCNL